MLVKFAARGWPVFVTALPERHRIGAIFVATRLVLLMLVLLVLLVLMLLMEVCQVCRTEEFAAQNSPVENCDSIFYVII